MGRCPPKSPTHTPQGAFNPPSLPHHPFTRTKTFLTEQIVLLRLWHQHLRGVWCVEAGGGGGGNGGLWSSRPNPPKKVGGTWAWRGGGVKIEKVIGGSLCLPK